MKYIFFILLLISSIGYGQTTYYIRADSTRLQKVGSNNELIIENGTRGNTGGVLTNIGNGRTSFVTPGSTMVYPGAGLPLSSGSAWLTSISNSSTVGHVLRVTGASTYAFGAIQAGDLPATSPYTLQQVFATQGNVALMTGINDWNIDTYSLTILTNTYNTDGLFAMNDAGEFWLGTWEGGSGETYIRGDAVPKTLKYRATNGHTFTGNINLNGSTSGTIGLNTQAAAGTYNWNWPTTAGTSGQVLTSAGGVAAPMTWTTPSTVATAVPLSGITAGIAANDINSGANAQTWRWNLKNTYGLRLMSTTTVDVATQALLHVELDGVSATNGLTTYGASISNGHTNATSGTNVALNLSATGATTANYALIVPVSSGSVGIGTSTPDSLLTVAGGGLYTNRGVRHTNLPDFADTTSYKPIVSNSSGTLYKATYWPGGGGASGITVGTTTITSGTDTRVPFNDGGVYGEDAGIVFNKTTDALTIGGVLNAGNLINSTGSNSGFVVAKRSDNSGVWIMYSSSGNLQFYNYAAGIDLLSIANTTGIITFSGTIIPRTGTASASTAPFKLTTGTNLTAPEAGALEYTTPQLFFTNGAAVRQELFQGQQARVYTQYDNTTTTLGTVTGLTTNVAAGKTYRFGVTLYTTSNIAGGIKCAIAGTATATNIIYESEAWSAGVPAATGTTRATALGTTVADITAVTVAKVVITGTITVNAAGTLLVQAAANAAVGTTSVLVGSIFYIIEML